jgi:hypothetical protein
VDGGQRGSPRDYIRRCDRTSTYAGVTELPGQALPTSELLRRGVTPYELQHPLWRHPYHGVARPSGADESGPLTRIRDAEALLPSCGCLGGWASLYLHGVAGIDGRDIAGNPRDVLLHTCERHRRITRPGVEPTRTRLLRDERTDVDDRSLTTIARAAYDEMCRARSVLAAVIVADLAVSRVSGGAHTTIDSLRRLIGRHRKTRGIRTARAAIELACERSASPLETQTRVLVVLEIPRAEFVANQPLFDLRGRLLGVPDLLDLRSGPVVESDGAPHAESSRRSRDHRRSDLFEGHHLTVARVTSHDHRDRDALMARLLRDHLRAR